MSIVLAGNPILSFNRTTVECKFTRIEHLTNDSVTFNRTTVECKWYP